MIRYRVYDDCYGDSVADESTVGNWVPYEVANELLQALKWVEMFWARDGEGHTEQFERVAEEFNRQTGFLRPGKDCRLHSYEDRMDEWDKWQASKMKACRAAISKAEGR